MEGPLLTRSMGKVGPHSRDGGTKVLMQELAGISLVELEPLSNKLRNRIHTARDEFYVTEGVNTKRLGGRGGINITLDF